MATDQPTSFCPRCDKEYRGATKEEADKQVRAHLMRQDDILHENALEEWDDSNG